MDFLYGVYWKSQTLNPNIAPYGSGNLEMHLKRKGDHEMSHYWAFQPNHYSCVLGAISALRTVNTYLWLLAGY